MKNRTLFVASLILTVAAGCQNGMTPPPPPAASGPRAELPVDTDLMFVTDEMVALENKSAHAAGTPKVLFANFGPDMVRGGGLCNDSKMNCSAIVQCPSAVAFPAYSGTADQKAEILRILRRYYVEFNITVVDTRPATGDYSMVMIGGAPTTVCYPTDAALGVALMDCDNRMENDMTFAFAEAAQNDPSTVALTIAQEHAHAYGLEHTNNMYDLLYPVALPGVESAGYLNMDMPILDAAGQPMNSRCDGSPTQNSHGRMLTVAGASDIMDTMPPTANITYPMDGQVGFRATSNVTIRATTNDDFPPYLYRSVDLVIDEGTPQAMTVSRTVAPYTFSQRFPEGTHTIQIKVTDSAMHVGMSNLVHFTVGMGAGGAGGAGAGGAGAGGAGAGGAGATGGAGSSGGAGTGTAGTGGAGAGGGAGAAGSSGSYGMACMDNAPGCDCVGFESGDPGVCSKQCSSNAQCTGGFKCLDLYGDGSKWCAPANFAPNPGDGGGESGGCATGNTPGGAGLLPLGLMIAALAISRRRRA